MLSALLFATSTGFASPAPLYDLTFSATAAHHEITASHLTLRPGRPAKISQADANGKIEVEISAQPKDGHIFIATDMYHVAPDGRRSHLGTPQILALNNEPASLEYGGKDQRTGRDVVQYSIRVLAKQK